MLGSHPHRKIGKNHLRVGCVDKLNSRERLHQSARPPPRPGIYCDRQRRVARHLGQIVIQPLAILIQPSESVSYSDSTIGSSRAFLRTARIKRAATQEFHEVNFLDRDVYLRGLACSRELARS